MLSDYSSLERLLACPLCGERFELVGMALRCGNRHTFDISRQGYVNFVDGKGKLPGDTRPMLEARRSFLNGNYYAPLSNTINRLVRAYLERQPLPEHGPPMVIEAGCGEGYYLARLSGQLTGGNSCDFLGLDISKEAIKMAATTYPQVSFAVANTHRRLPLSDNQVSVLLNIFSPRNVHEFYRVLAPGGLLLVVIPTPEHLNNLRARLNLLQMQSEKEQRVIEYFAPHFTLADSKTLSYTLNLTQLNLFHLVAMTPNYWHLSEDLKQVAQSLENFRVEVGFKLLEFHRL